MKGTSNGSVSLNNNGNIASFAFADCTGLANLTIGGSVGNIGTKSFSYCFCKTTDGVININNSGNIGESAFEYCKGVKDLTIGENVTDILLSAFYGSMTESVDAYANIGNNGSIDNSAFRACTSLASVDLAGTITRIGQNCFGNCSSLSEIIIPESITTIEQYTFGYCTSLKTVVLPETLTNIEAYAFDFSGLESIIIPALTKEIGNGAFNHCKSLEYFEAKDGNTPLSLGRMTFNKGAFADSPLKEVKIGRNLVYGTSANDGYSPFYGNSSLSSLTITDIPTEIFDNEFYGCTSLKEVSIGDGVTRIGDYAFSGCSSLESFAFGKRVESIGAEAFSDCTAMTGLYAEPTTPPVCGKQALADINIFECTLYVPTGAQESYAVADQWEDFFYVETFARSHSLTIGEPEMATLWLEYDAVIPDGVEVFYGADITSDGEDVFLKLTKIEGILPQNTGVLVKGTNGTTYEFIESNELGNEVESLLVGCADETLLGNDGYNYYNWFRRLDLPVFYKGAKFAP